jgi:glycosyltransferase involved in cell wall biosynthesis
MKIAVNALSARQGGGQTYLRNLFAHLPDRADVDVLVFAPPELDLPSHPRVRVALTRWPTRNPWMRALWERFALPRRLRDERTDVLFCPGGVVNTRPPGGCRTVTMFRNILPFDAPMVHRLPWGLLRLRILILRRVMLRSMAAADLTIFIAEHARKLIESLIQVPEAATIAHGVAPAFRTHDKLLERPAGAPSEYILYVSRFEHYKHHAEVVRAYAALPESLRQRHALLLLGENELPDGLQTASLIEQLRLTERILMPGAVPYESLPAYYQHAKLIVFASSCENCPNILLEAMASGRPVACSNVMPMPEFGGEGLIYFSPFDPRSIRDAMQSALLDPRLAATSAAAALERSRRFDWARTGSETWARIIGLGEQHGSTTHSTQQQQLRH